MSLTRNGQKFRALVPQFSHPTERDNSGVCSTLSSIGPQLEHHVPYIIFFSSCATSSLSYQSSWDLPPSKLFTIKSLSYEGTQTEEIEEE